MKGSKLRAQQRRQKKRSRTSGQAKKHYVPKVYWSGLTLKSDLLQAMREKCTRVQLIVEMHLRTGLSHEEMVELSDYLNLVRVSAVHRAGSFEQEAYEEYCEIFCTGCEALQEVIDRVRKDYHGQPKDTLHFVCTGPQLQAIYAAVEAAGNFAEETINTCPMIFLHEAMALPKLYNLLNQGHKLTKELIDQVIKQIRTYKDTLAAIGLDTALGG